MNYVDFQLKNNVFTLGKKIRHSFKKYEFLERFILRQLIANFVLKNAFKKYQPQRKFKFQQLIVNFADFWQNNSLIMDNNHTFK